MAVTHILDCAAGDCPNSRSGAILFQTASDRAIFSALANASLSTEKCVRIDLTSVNGIVSIFRLMLRMLDSNQNIGNVMTMSKRACLVFVTATSGILPIARARLEAEGYEVCEVLADLIVAIAAAAGDADLPADLKNCIERAEVCVFLLPEDAVDDGCLGVGGGYASQLGKPFIGVVVGSRESLPPAFDADAAGIVHDCDEGLTGAIRGDRSFKQADGTRASDRIITNIKCQ